MLELKKSYDANCREKFLFDTEEGSFIIYYGDDLSLYWSCTLNDDMQNCYKYTVTKDNESIYKIFDELYDSVVSKRPFKHFNSDEPEKYYAYDDNGLIENNAIEWHSDAFNYDAASVLKIEKDNETENLVVTFKKSKVVADEIGSFSTYSVKISTGLSRYDPYNASFIDMYNKLSNYCEKFCYSFGSNNKKRKVRFR